MAVEVLHDCEPNYMPAEHCAKCNQKTRYWYEPNDVALCQACALVSSDSDIPTKRAWLESDGKTTHPEGWMSSTDRRAAEIKLPESICLRSFTTVAKTEAVMMVNVDVALALLQSERDKSDIEALHLTQQIACLSRIVDVYDARIEGKETPVIVEAQPYQKTPVVLAPDRVVQATPVYDHRTDPRDMIEVAHLRRFLSGEESRARVISYSLKTKLEQLQKEIESYIQSGDLK